MELNKKIIVSIILGFSVLLSFYEGFLYLNGYLLSEKLSNIWGLFFTYLLAGWIYLDSKNRDDIEIPFDYGYLILIFWIPYVPYYFIKTRRTIGLLYFLGLIWLLNLGYFVKLIIYYLVY